MENKKRKIVGISVAICVILLCAGMVACTQSKKANTTGGNAIDSESSETESVDVTEAKETETEELTETETATVEVISEEESQAKVDKDEVVTTPETTKGNTSSNSNSSNNTPVAETPKAHEHSWQPVYTTVHHDAVTHTEQQDKGHYETIYLTVTSDGKEFTANQDKELEDYMYNKQLAGTPVTCGEVSHETWIPNVVTVIVVDKAAYDEQVIDHYECSCGATK